MKTITVQVGPLRHTTNSSESSTKVRKVRSRAGLSGRLASAPLAKNRKKAIRTARFWSKRLQVEMPDLWLLDLAAQLGGKEDTSYHTSSLVLGMMLALRQTKGESSQTRSRLVSVLKQWT